MRFRLGGRNDVKGSSFWGRLEGALHSGLYFLIADLIRDLLRKKDTDEIPARWLE